MFAAAWYQPVLDDPIEAIVSALALTAGTVVAAYVLRRAMRHVRSLRHQVLVVTLAALAIGALASVLLARLMVIDSRELERVVVVLSLTAVFATLLVLVASAPLGHDARQLAVTVRRIESGDRQVRTEVHRSDELGHVAHALDELTRMLDELERQRTAYEQERTTMLSNIGHDLRTPLAALQAAVEAMADGVAPDPERYLRSMQRDIEALSALVDDFFLLARLEAGRYDVHLAPVDLTEIADEAIEALAPVAATKDVAVTLEATDRAHVRGSANAIARVVRNLVDNAIRHAPEGSEVRVSVASDGRPSVRIIDAGPGFPNSFADQAFGRFTRADSSRTRATGGAGLGLTIARGIVEAHGGRIWIERHAGGCVAFELPGVDEHVA